MGQYYAINGSFLLEPALGVQRYAAEILKQMNKMAPAYKECLRLVLVLPETPRIEEIRREFSNIEVRCAGKSRRVKVWEHGCFARFLKKEKAKGICLCNTVPLFSKGGLVCVHDIVFKTHPEYFKEPGAWHEILYRKWMYTHAFHKADIIVTVSETSKKEILEQYRVRAGQIYVAGNGWQHMDRKDTDETIFQKYPKLTKGAYYYYLASLAPNKNLSWILKNAAGNPDKIYGVADSGGAYLLTNVAAMTKNKKFAKAAHTKAPDFSPNALGLISGMFYTTRFDKIGLFLPSYLYGKGYKKKAIAPYVNIENPEIVSALPPCFLVTSHSDNLEHYTVKFEKALKANRVSHKLLRFGKNKKLTHAFSVFEPFYKESTKTLKSMHEYFQSF